MTTLSPGIAALRLDEILEFESLKSSPEAAFDDITCLAAHICQTPVAFLTLMDGKRKWLKSKFGLTTKKTKRYLALCSLALKYHQKSQSDLIIVADASADRWLGTNLNVSNDPKIGFLAAANLVTSGGQLLGVLFVMDYVPRELSVAQQEALKALSRLAIAQLELRKNVTNQEQTIAKRQPVEEAGRESCERFRLLAENSTDMISRHTPEGIYVYASPACRNILGYEPEDLVGHSAYEFFHPEDLDEIVKSHSSILEVLDTNTVAYRIRTKSGHYIWLETTARSIRDKKTGDVVEIQALSRDISERKQTEEKLLQLASIVESCDDAIISNTLDGIILSWNSAAERIYGYSAVEVKGCYISILVPPDRPHEMPQILEKIKRGERINQYETVRLRKDGSLINVSLTISPIKDARGKIIGASTIARDITLAKHKESERLQSIALQQAAVKEALAARNQIANILESIADAFFTLDNEWRFTYLNLRAEQILFRPRNELIGKCVWDELPEAVGSTFETEFRRAVSQQVTVHFEEFYSSLGIWFEVRAYPYQEGLSVYFRDVTKRKHAEAAMLEQSRLSTLEAEIGTALRQIGTLEESLNKCTEAMMQHLDATFAGIWTFNQQFHCMEAQAISGSTDIETPDADMFSKCCRSLDGCLIGFVAQTHQPYLTQDSGKQSRGGFETRVYSGQLAESCSLISDSYFGGYPLIVEQRLVGVMAVSRRQPFSEASHDLLHWVANAIAVAIDRAWARIALLSRRESLLFRLANQIRNSLDLDTILGTAVSEIRSLLQIDRCHFLWCWPDANHPSLTVTHESLGNPNLPSLMGDYSTKYASALMEKMRDLEPILINEIAIASELDAYKHELLNNLGITSQLLLPVKTHTGQLGAIVCSHCRGPRSWSDSEVELLQAVVDQLACAIDQAEHYAQTRATARAAQTQAQQLELTLRELKQTQAQLIQTEKMSSLGQMVAGIAHEINNPVSFITGNLSHTSNYMQDLLELIHLYQKHYPAPDPEIQAHTEEIDLEFILDDLPKMLSSMQMGADRIRQIVLSLRNFSRLDEAEKKPVDIHEGLDNTLLILHHRLKPKGTQAEIQVIKEYGNLPLVECYACQLNQVFMNILSNGIDALETQPDPRIITIQTSVISDFNNEQQTNDRVVIRIRDNGPGMTENIKKRLFDPFFTTKPVGKGTGLGLSISYQIVVDKHGGVLDCISEPGKGTEFWIQIPLQQ